MKAQAPSKTPETLESLPEEDIVLSVIVPVTERPEPLDWVYSEFAPGVRDLGVAFEFIFAVDGPNRWMASSLEPLRKEGEPIRIIQMGQTMGESSLLEAAASRARGRLLLTLPPYPRVAPAALGEVVRAVDQETDLASAVRSNPSESFLNRVQRRIFHFGLNRTVGGGFRDIASGVRAMRRKVMEEVDLYGDFFRFLPVLASRAGFRVREIAVPQHDRDRRTRVYSPGIYLRRLIDVLGLMFLVRFTFKPLRFFGLVGSGLALAGGGVLVVLLFQRMGGQAMADRPLLLLGVLLVVLGIQAIAMGLIGEIIVHLNASRRRLYRLEGEPGDEVSEGTTRDSESTGRLPQFRQ